MKVIQKLQSRLTTSLRSISTTALNNGKLDGKIAIMTGCTEGIGLAMAKRMAEDGAHVILSSRQQKNVDKAVNSLTELNLQASGMACHVGNPEERTNLIETTAEVYGGIDILVNNAGVNPHTGSFLTTPESAFDKTFDVNVKANFCLVRDVVPHMVKRKTPCSVLMTSSVSGMRCELLPSAYAVSKCAILGLTKAFVPELHKVNIRVNCLTFGIISTRFSEILTENPDVFEENFLKQIPMGRAGEPDECAGIASFLCSSDASYITGENFVVSGGTFSRL